MANIHIDWRIRATPAMIRWWVPGLLLAALAPELATESVSLTTYYPAPSGVYTQMITTGNTYLARDPIPTGATVGIGTTNPIVSAKLHVAGRTVLQNVPIFEGRNAAGIFAFSIDPGAVINFNGFDSTTFEFMKVNNSAGLGSYNKTVNFPTKVGVQNASPVTNLDVGGEGILVSRQPSGNCVAKPYTGGGVGGTATTPCPLPNQYATMIEGVMARYSLPWFLNEEVTAANVGDGVMLCCSCPSTGCPGAGSIPDLP